MITTKISEDTHPLGQTLVCSIGDEFEAECLIKLQHKGGSAVGFYALDRRHRPAAIEAFGRALSAAVSDRSIQFRLTESLYRDPTWRKAKKGSPGKSTKFLPFPTKPLLAALVLFLGIGIPPLRNEETDMHIFEMSSEAVHFALAHPLVTIH